MKIKKKYQGVIVPAVVPLNAKLRLDEQGVENMFANFNRYGAYPFILGTTGESASLSMSLKADYIKLSGKLKRPGDMLYTGITSNCIEESVELAKLSFANGTDAVVASLPSYYALSERDMKIYFEQLANECKGPLIIYNIPATTHMSIPLKVIDELSYHENIVATKDSERSDDRLKEALHLWAARQDFSYFLGWAARSAIAMLNGGDGIVPSTGNLLPGIYTDMYTAAYNGDVELVHALQKKSDMFGALYQKSRSLGESLWALKVLMNEKNLCDTHVMPPLQPQTMHDEELLRQSLHILIEQEGLVVKNV
ncbi:dihydrodipicolinate synthase family protein [Mucilaginibacter sp. PPCGB 2223]|uniref:dihydrodipicolinate synthase family protein n=1 Tax=Mucilaginibacter sp. PPCGB 2223 TaxID=1886027 RepID=UPI0008270392|nr:dihydrodipicolinate synthase family protein [Mucilaginibacter sp. PPCGB 2223]OCX53031.1 dihydrodipicolinate synthase family protein [Mucilaginibacter sp. PPCGB 2223]